MDDLRLLSVFACVVRNRSMSAAARELGVSPSAVSQGIRALERRGGVTLLHRSTRKLSLTEAGERLHQECAVLEAAAARARHQLELSRDAPVGELRLSCAVGFARHVAPALRDLMSTNPALRLRLLVDDMHIDLVESRVDLALRFGRLPDSRWVARKLCRFEMWLCAAPAYLARHGKPAQPGQLLRHQWLGWGPQGGPLTVPLRPVGGGPEVPVTVEPRITSNNQLSLQQMCAAGLGVARLGSLDVQDDLRSGTLVRLMPDWPLPPLDVWAVTPQRDAQPAKVRHAVQALHDYLRTLPGVLPD